MQTIDFTLPAHWASAIINGDFTGLDFEEAQAVRYWLDTEPDIAGDALSCTDEAEFTAYYDAEGLPCMCLTFTFPYCENTNTLPALLNGTAPELRHRT